MPENPTAAAAPLLAAAPTPVNPAPPPGPPPGPAPPATPAAPAMPGRAPDAILCPRDVLHIRQLLSSTGNVNFRRFPHYGYRAKYGPVLYRDLPGVKHVVQVRAQGAQHLLTRDAEGLLFPLGDPHEAQERHEWWLVQESPIAPPLVPPRRAVSFRDHPGGVLLGFLRDPQGLVSTDGGTVRFFRAATTGQLQEYRAKLARWNQLVEQHVRNAGHLNPEEVGEVIELGQYLERLMHQGFEDPFSKG